MNPIAKLKAFAADLQQEIKIYQFAIEDPRVPKAPKILLGIALAYLLSPVDLIPDFIPGIGHLDDLIIVPALVILALRMIPSEVIQDCRNLANGIQPVQDRSLENA